MLPILPVPAVAVIADAPTPSMSRDQLLDLVEQKAVRYFWDNASPTTGLVLDRSPNGKAPDLSYSPCSIAAVGFGLTALVVADRHHWLPSDAVRDRIRVTLQTFEKMPNVHGFFYHFVDPLTGERYRDSELSDIDTTLFIVGALTAAQAYPNSDISRMANDLYHRIDWPWLLDGGATLRMGWRPESGYISERWDHYDESSVMYVLAIGSPTHPLPKTTWTAVERHTVSEYGHTFLDSPSLFQHQYSQLYLDLRDKTDGHFDYWASSRSATLAHRQYAIESQHAHAGWGADTWGITACDGPDGYSGYSLPPTDGPAEDGTIAPTAALGSYQFTPDESYRVLRSFAFGIGPRLWGRYGFSDAFNLDRVWFAPDVLGIDQGPEVLSIENQRTGLIWNLFMRDTAVQRGLRLCGFR